MWQVWHWQMPRPRASRGHRGVGKFRQGLRVSEDVQCCPMSTGPCQSLYYISVTRVTAACPVFYLLWRHTLMFLGFIFWGRQKKYGELEVRWCELRRLITFSGFNVFLHLGLIPV